MGRDCVGAQVHDEPADDAQHHGGGEPHQRLAVRELMTLSRSRLTPAAKTLASRPRRDSP